MAKKNRVVLNDYGRKKSGRTGGHVSVHMSGEPLIHDFDEQKLARGPADAIRDKAEKGVRSINQQAAASTIARRRSKGRSSTKLFNDTGALARGLTVRETRDGYETVAPANRLKGLPPDVVEQLIELAEIGPEDLVKDRRVKSAIEASIRDLIQVKKR